jgi:hypothetical protein
MPPQNPKATLALKSKSMRHVVGFVLLALFALGAGCTHKPDLFVTDGDLDFDQDTVHFDTIFTNMPSPTERLVVRNNSGKNLLIKRIALEQGNDYSLIFDGITANEIKDFELPNGDSVIAFIKFTSETKDDYARDRMLFTIGDNTQKVEIEAFVWDAIFYRDSTLGGFGQGNLTVMGPDHKHVIDGSLVVADGHTLRILAGTQLYFTSRKDANFNLVSSIIVFGRLLVEGRLDAEVVFQQTRFGEDYIEAGNQWRGIAFANISKGNSIDHAIIKNGLIGVYQEYGNAGASPKVAIKNTEIRNMGAYGVLSVGYIPILSEYPNIYMENCLVHNCVEGTFAIIGGGKYLVRQCTFANYTVDFTRNRPQLLINNYDSVTVFPIESRFENCIVWGSEEEEFAPDSFPTTNAYDVTFHSTLIRTTLPTKGSNIIASQDFDFPKFQDPTAGDPSARNYRLKEESPAKNVGMVIPGIHWDIEELPYFLAPPAGCYEFKE